MKKRKEGNERQWLGDQGSRLRGQGKANMASRGVKEGCADSPILNEFPGSAAAHRC